MASTTLDVLRQRLTHDDHVPIATRIGKGVDFALGLATAPVYLRDCQRVGRWARTVGAPLVRNVGRIEIGDHVVINSELARVRLEVGAGATLTLGAGTLVHYGATLRAGCDIVIGERVYVGPRSVTGGADDARPITIGDGVWIGQAVTIRPGSRIGARAVIAAGSVVDGEIPAGVVALGAPAQSVRSIDARADEEDTRMLPHVGGLARLFTDLLVPPARASARAIAAARSEAPKNEWREMRERMRTAVVLRDVDRVGRGVRVTGRVVVRNLGRVEIGDEVEIRSDPELTHLATGVAGTLIVGRGARLGSGCGICAYDRVEIGAETTIDGLCSILDTSFHGVSDRARVARPRPVVIGRRVRLGAGTLVMPGARIGDGATVEPCSVVTREVAPGAHVGGVPARPV